MFLWCSGYMAPEYLVRGQLTEKADVYSFGVLVLEIVCGRRNNLYSQDFISPLQTVSFTLSCKLNLVTKKNLLDQFHCVTWGIDSVLPSGLDTLQIRQSGRSSWLKPKQRIPRRRGNQSTPNWAAVHTSRSCIKTIHGTSHINANNGKLQDSDPMSTALYEY